METEKEKILACKLFANLTSELDSDSSQITDLDIDIKSPTEELFNSIVDLDEN